MDAFMCFAFLSLIYTIDETVDAQDVEEGDHIYRWSCIFGLKYLKTHSHHAIVIKKTGNQPQNVWVIEFMRNAQNETNLQKVTLQEFINNGHHNTVHRVTYQDNIVKHWLKRNGSSSIETPLPSRKVVKRATKLFELNSTLKEPVERIYKYYYSSRLFQSTNDGEETPIDHGPWSLTANNCECCVRWCKVDKWNSLQASNGFYMVLSTMLTLMAYMITSEWVASYLFGKTIIDTTSLALELAISAYSGVSQEEIRKLIPELIARRVCNISALGLASIVGSPVVLGAATSFMIYDASCKKLSPRTFIKTTEVC